MLIKLHKYFILIALFGGGFFIGAADLQAATDDHGNSATAATAAAFGKNIAGRIEVRRDVDYFKFQVPRKGLLTVFTRGGTDTYGVLSDASGKVLKRSNDGAASTDGKNFRLRYQVPGAGTYYVAVRYYRNAGAGRYVLRATFRATAVTADDHGNTVASASALTLNSSSIVAGNIERAGDLDYFRFTLTQKGKLVVTTTGNTDTFGRLHAADGKVLVANNDAGAGNNFRITRTLNAGTYLVSVRHRSSTGTGTYQLRLTFTPGTASSGFLFPFKAGRTWTVCQGYNTASITHVGTLRYALDLSIDPDSANGSSGCLLSTAGASTGQSVLAPAAGKIAWEGMSLGLKVDVVCLVLDKVAGNGGRSVMLGHLSLQDGLGMGSVVKSGQLLGTVNAPSAMNGAYAHIHVSMYQSATCQGSSMALGKVFGGSYDFSTDGSTQQWRGTRVSR
ncbi:MAG: PPC domain-containing protein [Thiothrix sp.]|nr:PPC domain-containing protein [Thiothrix sp.]